MKKRYMIGLFFVCAVIVVLAAVLVMLGSNNKNIQDETPNADMDSDIQGGGTQDDTYDDAGASQAQSMGIITTKDTMCIYENIDQKDGTVSMVEAKLPSKYVGLNRVQLESALLLDGSLMLFDENEDGFKSQHLELFSPERIKILRIYDSTAQTGGYYILDDNGEICIYEQDRKTLYFRTGINIQDLPESVAEEVSGGKYMESEVQVYHFLESYSS